MTDNYIRLVIAAIAFIGTWAIQLYRWRDER